jgi:hypothetical protein
LSVLSLVSDFVKCNRPIAYLICPFVVRRKIDVVDEERHRLSRGRPVRAAHPLVHVRLDLFLEELRSRRRAKVARHQHVVLAVVLFEVRVDHGRLGRSLGRVHQFD